MSAAPGEEYDFSPQPGEGEYDFSLQPGEGEYDFTDHGDVP